MTLAPRTKRRRLALAVLLAAAALAVVAFPLRETWWGGWLLAVAEAGVVGGLADWFAVTALFRRPLGLPIPHTALIPANWEQMAARVGSMVGRRVITAEYVSSEIARADLADLLARATLLIKPSDLEAGVRAVARWAVDQVSSESAADLAGWLRARLLDTPIAPLLADALDVARRQGWDERVIAMAAAALGGGLDRPQVQQAAADVFDDVVTNYRSRLGVYPRMVMDVAGLLGLIDRRRAVLALRGALAKVASDRDDPLRRRILEALAALPARLRSDPALASRIEAIKLEILETAAVTQVIEDAARAVYRAVADDVQSDHPGIVRWVTDRLEAARQALASDAELRSDVDAWLKRHAIGVVEAHHARIASFVERGVRALGAEGAVRLIEDHVGDDLQYIRVNGTVVGGLAGGAIYGIHLLLSRFF